MGTCSSNKRTHKLTSYWKIPEESAVTLLRRVNFDSLQTSKTLPLKCIHILRMMDLMSPIMYLSCILKIFTHRDQGNANKQHEYANDLPVNLYTHQVRREYASKIRSRLKFGVFLMRLRKTRVRWKYIQKETFLRSFRLFSPYGSGGNIYFHLTRILTIWVR